MNFRAFFVSIGFVLAKLKLRALVRGGLFGVQTAGLLARSKYSKSDPVRAGRPAHTGRVWALRIQAGPLLVHATNLLC